MIKENYWEKYKEIFDSIDDGMFGIDKEGNPVYYMSMAGTKWGKLVNNGTLDDIKNFFIHMYERTLNVVFPMCSLHVNKRVERMTVIYDYKGFNSTTFLKGKLIKLVELMDRFDNKYYPGVFNQVFHINTSLLFSIFWNFLKLKMSKDTKKRQHVLKKKYKTRLLEVISSEQLHEEYGGEAKGTLKHGRGPFKQEINHSFNENRWYLKDKSVYVRFYLDPEEKEKFLKEN